MLGAQTIKAAILSMARLSKPEIPNFEFVVENLADKTVTG